jgi:hypothetical protein
MLRLARKHRPPAPRLRKRDGAAQVSTALAERRPAMAMPSRDGMFRCIAPGEQSA